MLINLILTAGALGMIGVIAAVIVKSDALAWLSGTMLAGFIGGTLYLMAGVL